ncbi:MAG: DinB family protein [Actinocrinis sp.]
MTNEAIIITATAQDRVDSPLVGGERAMLTAFLDWQRATLAWKCSGLTAGRLALRSVEPSGMSLLGLLRHLTEVERGWFARTIGEQEVTPIFYSPERRDDDFDDLGSHPADEVYQTWLAACEDSRRIVADHDLDYEGHGRTRAYSLRWVLLHMIEEYARHNGHAVLLRERIDGTVGE